MRGKNHVKNKKNIFWDEGYLRMLNSWLLYVIYIN